MAACYLSVIATVFIGTSLDGFIARLNGAFDFLPAGGRTLKHAGTRQYASGLVQSEYVVV
jgi:hypothetical protein